MYQDSFGFEQKPFRNTPDPAFFYFSVDHRKALATINRGVQDCCGLILLLGELGTGKTTVCYHVYEHGDFQSAYVNNPFLNELEFLQKVNRQLGIPASQRSRKFLIDALKCHLLRQHRSGKRVLLIVDEAHRLGLPILDQILILSNLQLPDAQLLQIVLAAQPTLLHSLRYPRLSSLNERIGVRHHLRRLDRTNTIDYIYHRLRRAGCTNPSLFTSNALDTIWRASRGTPRLINHLCEHALGGAYCKGKKTVGKREVKCVTEDPIYRPLFPTGEKFWSMRPAVAGSVLTLCACLFGALWYFGPGRGFVSEPIKQVRQFPSEHRTIIREHIIMPDLADRREDEPAKSGPRTERATVSMVTLDKAEPSISEVRAPHRAPSVYATEPLGKPMSRTAPMPTEEVLPDLKLSAIAWDENSARSIAVLNERILHEGDFLGDIRVLRIKPDHVVLLQGDLQITKEIQREEDVMAKREDVILNDEGFRTQAGQTAEQSYDDPTQSASESKSVIRFAYRNSKLDPSALADLAGFAASAKQNTDHDIVVLGYTDSVGSHAYNKGLAESRANIVESYLVGKGIDPVRIKTIGMGEKNPLMPNTTPKGRAANRRVEIELVPSLGD